MSSYYQVLGISRFAGLDEIRRAYWSLERRVRLESAKGLQVQGLDEIRRAYDVLSDSNRRSLYDARHPAESSLLEGCRIVYDDFRELNDGMVNEFPSTATITDVVSTMDSDFLADRVWSVETHSTEVEVTASEARNGVRVPWDLVFRSDCPICGGRGEVWSSSCGICAGTGSGEMSNLFELAIPPGVRHGACLKFTVTPPFSAEIQIRAHIAIK